MFGLKIDSSYIKYIGIFLVSVILIITFIGFYNVVNDEIHKVFGIKTKEEKLADLKLKTQVEKENVNNLKKEVIITNKIKDIDKNISVSYLKQNIEETKVINNIKEKAKVIKKPTITVSKIKKHKDSEKQIEKTYYIKDVYNTKTVKSSVKKEKVISFSISKQEYTQYGTDNINSIYEMYNFIKEKK